MCNLWIQYTVLAPPRMLVANHSSSYTYTIHKCAGAGKHTILRTFAKSRPTMRFPVRSHTTSKTVTERSKASVFIWACFIYIVFWFNDALLATQAASSDKSHDADWLKKDLVVAYSQILQHQFYIFHVPCIDQLYTIFKNTNKYTWVYDCKFII